MKFIKNNKIVITFSYHDYKYYIFYFFNFSQYNKSVMEVVMEKLMDLHTHTIYSDGDKTPKEIIAMAKEMNLSTIAITDHDVIDGIKTLREEDLEGINFIPGVELTAKVDRGRMHILGYDIDINDQKLNEKLHNRNDVHNFLLYVEEMKKMFNISFSDEEIFKITHSIGNIGRPDLAKLLIEHGYCQTVDQAFDNYLNPAMEQCRSRKKGYSKEECIQMILESGGIPVLAHPISLEMSEEELRHEITYLKEIGLKGIEIYHINHSKEYTDMLENIARDLDLFTTGGTDYHGSVKPKVKLGTGIDGNVKVVHSTMVDYLMSEKRAKVKCMTPNKMNK